MSYYFPSFKYAQKILEQSRKFQDNFQPVLNALKQFQKLPDHPESK